MERIAYKELLNWKTSPSRKPLLLLGARQTGKTWLMEEFGKNEFKNVISLNFEKQPASSDYFDNDISPSNIINILEQRFATEINAENTLIIMDEIQESEGALNSLKYFCEDAPEYHIIAAGSFLGVASHGSFPVGKVDRITILPLSFYEFLEGTGKERYAQTLRNLDYNLIRTTSGDFEKLLKTYYLVGGMPKAVAAFAERGDLREVRSIQKNILDDYRDDFSKHISVINTPKVEMIWDSIPRHLSKEKKKFVYKEITEGARAYTYEDAMNWLFNTRLVTKVSRTEENKLPLASFADEKAFKLYMHDTGLFCAKAEIDITVFFEHNNELLSYFNGAITEQYIMQELVAAGFKPYYWGRERGEAEVDFIIQWRNEIIPIEVKSGFRKKSKSLDVYRHMYNPKKAVRASLRNFGQIDGTDANGKNHGALYSIPLYMIASINEIFA